MKSFYLPSLIIFLICVFRPTESKAYSILSHQAIVDAAWKTTILPELLKKYPASTDSLLKVAHAYAYGGSVAADMGYFPFGSTFYSDLVHYVRSGDFIISLLDESKELNEYAFALAFISHYIGDKYGHSMATNKITPLLYPKVKKKYGNVVTYEQDKTAHARTEFGFDVLQLARGSYESQAYHDFIGFQISKSLLERSFMKTYGLDINDVFGNFSLAIGSFRWSVKNLFPTLTRAAWKSKKAEIQKLKPGITSRQFKYKMDKKAYYKEFGTDRHKPGLGASLLSFALRIIPKIGPLKKLRFKVPGPEIEKIFIQSFDTTSFYYMRNIRLAGAGNLILPNIDYDTGQASMHGEYNLADETYLNLLLKLKDDNFKTVTPNLKQNILKFFDSPSTAKIEEKKKQSLYEALAALKAFNP